MIHRVINIVLVLLFVSSSFAQTITTNDPALAGKYPFVNTIFNRIQNSNGLDTFYQRLSQLKKTGEGVLSIVHIGDSHLQAGFISEVVRHGLQNFFGNAGRGLVFPYQLAESNAPDDISSYSNTRWQYNRIAHPEIPLKPGISGFGIESATPDANIHLSVKQLNGIDPSFNKLQLFLGTENNRWTLKSDGSGSVYTGESISADTAGLYTINLNEKSTGFFLTSASDNSNFAFYGASLQNGHSGILYHTIGVNGSRYDQYNIASLFWQQLPTLKADLYIISLGTNEAQRAAFVEASFLHELNKFLELLRKSSPGAAILITTSPDSYKARRSNMVLKQFNQSLINYCQKNHIPAWDLYQITNGHGSAHSWARRGLMNRDRIHFTAEGYRLQGSLLFNALAKGYNTYGGF